MAPNKNVHGDFADLPSRRDEPPPYWGWRLLFCVNLRGEALMISLHLHVNGDISLYACQGPAGLPDVKAKSISRPLPSCPSMHFIGTTLSLCSPALFSNGLIGKIKKRKVGGKEILLAPTKQVRSRLYHRGYFKVIFCWLNINQLSTPTVTQHFKFHMEQIGSQPTYCLEQLNCFLPCLDFIFCIYLWS